MSCLVVGLSQDILSRGGSPTVTSSHRTFFSAYFLLEINYVNKSLKMHVCYCNSKKKIGFKTYSKMFECKIII